MADETVLPYRDLDDLIGQLVFDLMACYDKTTEDEIAADMDRTLRAHLQKFLGQTQQPKDTAEEVHASPRRHPDYDAIDAALDAYTVDPNNSDDGPGGHYAERLRDKMKAAMVAYQMAGGIDIVRGATEQAQGRAERIAWSSLDRAFTKWNGFCAMDDGAYEPMFNELVEALESQGVEVYK